MSTIASELKRGLDQKDRNIDKKLGSLEGMLKAAALPAAARSKNSRKEKIQKEFAAEPNATSAAEEAKKRIPTLGRREQQKKFRETPRETTTQLCKRETDLRKAV